MSLIIGLVISFGSVALNMVGIIQETTLAIYLLAGTICMLPTYFKANGPKIEWPGE